MSYFASRRDLELRYGADNLKVMADPDGDEDATVVAAHIAVALTRADTWIYGKLRKSLYSHCLPTIVDRSGAVPDELKDIAVMRAGWWLASSRGNRPINNLLRDKAAAEELITEIAKGETYLLDCEA